MRLYGSRPAHSNSYYTPANVYISGLNISKPITFLMDTGCEITTINYGDARSLNIHNIVGQVTKSRGIGGVRVDNVPLHNCGVYFFLNNYTSIHFEILQIILVSKPIITSENYDAIMGLPSLLGMDFLQRYKMSFRNNQVILEK